MSKGGNKEIDRLLLSIIKSAPYGIMAINEEGKILMINQMALDYLDHFNINPQNCQQISILELVSEVGILVKKLKRSLTKRKWKFDLEEVVHNERFLTFRGRRIVNGMIITIADISSIKDSEKKIISSMLEGQEIERKRLAREIHDGIGPTLSTIKMNLGTIQSDMEKLDEGLKKKFSSTYAMIDDLTSDLRSISHNLMPKVLQDFGIIEALDSLCERVEVGSSIRVRFIHSGMGRRLAILEELGLYRICQELINNTLKHSKATQIIIQFLMHENSIVLSYEDNGIGFDTSIRSEGIGIANVESRALALDGIFTLDSGIGKGMIATIEVPLIRKIG